MLERVLMAMKLRATASWMAVTTLVVAQVPEDPPSIWKDFRPREEPLKVEVLEERTEKGTVYQHVRFVVGTFGGKTIRVAAHYARPVNKKQGLPGLVHLHGGGQRARVDEVGYWASQGFAAISVNWGELPIGVKEGVAGTDWAGLPAGFVEPKHHNAITPAPGTLHKEPHPWNSSWILYSAAVRRALTFLEFRKEVDGELLGVTGHSMGGRLAMLSANDRRLWAVSPSVGGSGFLYEDFNGIPGSARRMTKDLALYKKTLGCGAYWPRMGCPLLFLTSSNDFNAPLELVSRGFSLSPRNDGVLSITPHLNHRFSSECYAARVWFLRARIQGEFVFPKQPKGEVSLDAEDKIVRFQVQPDPFAEQRLTKVEVFYGQERDPRVRYLRKVIAKPLEEEEGVFEAACPIHQADEPLYVFANLTYDMGKKLELPRGYQATSLMTISTVSVTASPAELKAAGIRPTLKRERVIDASTADRSGWALVSPNNPHHFEFKTYKVGDARFFGPKEARLAFEVTTTSESNSLAVILEVDQWRGYTGRKYRRYVAMVDLPEKTTKVSLERSQFVDEEGVALPSYDFVTALVLRPGNKEKPGEIMEQWRGKLPVLRHLHWDGGTMQKRPKPYLR